MAYRALKSFSGLISMIKGEVREIEDEYIAKDLVRCGFVVDLSEKQKAAAKSSKSTKTKGGEA